MINLELDLAYLSRYYNIGHSTLEKYRSKSITQIMQIEAAKGNKKAAEFLMQITTDPKELARVFQLINPKNRFLILIHMNQEDLMKIMSNLDPKQLVLGLSIFNPEALVELMKKLEPEALAKIVEERIGQEKFIKNLPEKYLDEFLSSDKIEKEVMLKAMENVDDEQLQKMMENVTGQPCYDGKDSILQQMNKMEDKDFKKAILGMEVEGKRQLTTNIIKEKPELFKEFSAEAMTSPFKTMEKEEILKSLTVLKTEELLPMVEDLPKEIMALVATQIDPKIFSQILCSEFSDVIANCGINI